MVSFKFTLASLNGADKYSTRRGGLTNAPLEDGAIIGTDGEQSVFINGETNIADARGVPRERQPICLGDRGTNLNQTIKGVRQGFK